MKRNRKGTVKIAGLLFMLLFLSLASAGCPESVGDPPGAAILTGDCASLTSPVSLSSSVTVKCPLVTISATITGDDMTTINVELTAGARTSVNVPSGSNRYFTYSITLSDGSVVSSGAAIRFCVPDSQPVNITLNIDEPDSIDHSVSIDPAGGMVKYGEHYELTASVSRCLSVSSYQWSSDNPGWLSGTSGQTVTLTPSGKRGTAEVTVNVSFTDGETAEKKETFTIEYQ